MPRLKFDLKPLPHPYCGSPDAAAEHEAWVRKVFAKHHPDEDPRPCDCGYFEPTVLVLCDKRQRRQCHHDPLGRLERAYRERHLKALRGKRVFPGPPFRRAVAGICWWCGGWLPKTKKGTFVQRVFHNGRRGEPDCSHQEDLHTQMTVQRSFLLKRDGLGCKACGSVEGKWSGWARLDTPELVSRWWSNWPGLAKRFAEKPGPVTLLTWNTYLEVDHVVALGLVAHLPDDERRAYFGPTNLQLLCCACHKVKTRSDTRLIRALQAELSKNGDVPA